MTVAWEADAPQKVRERRLRLLAMLSRGYTTAEMAREMDLSERTIKNHLQELFGALGAKSRAHAVGIAYRWGLLRTTATYPPATPEVVVQAVAEALQVDLRALAATR